MELERRYEINRRTSYVDIRARTFQAEKELQVQEPRGQVARRLMCLESNELEETVCGRESLLALASSLREMHKSWRVLVQ